MNPERGRRRFLLGAVAGALGMLAPAAATLPRTIPVKLKRFVFDPSTIRLARGEAIVFELTSLDVPMGFSLPDFGLRSDVMPGAGEMNGGVQRIAAKPHAPCSRRAGQFHHRLSEADDPCHAAASYQFHIVPSSSRATGR